MRSDFLGLVALVALFGCGPKQDEMPVEGVALDQTSNEVLSVIHDLFQAMEARDSTRVGFTLHPEALFVSVDLSRESSPTKRTEARDFISAVGQPGEAYIERIQNAVVHHSGDFAEVWAPYEFYIGDSLSHCGHDAFQLVRQENAWRILGITYSVTTCP